MQDVRSFVRFLAGRAATGTVQELSVDGIDRLDTTLRLLQMYIRLTELDLKIANLEDDTGDLEEAFDTQREEALDTGKILEQLDLDSVPNETLKEQLAK